MKKKGLLICLLLCVAVSLSDCKKKKNTPGDEDDSETAFDKGAMLANYADALIIPNYQSAKIALDSLDVAYAAFAQSKSVADLQIVRQKLQVMYVRFQHISTSEFGQAETELLRANFNTYPADTAQINANIASGTYNLDIAANIDAKGLPAMDFLFYGKQATDAGIAAWFAASPNRIAYVTACLSEMKTKLNAVLSAWTNGYRTSFVNSQGSQIGSSLGLLVNQLNFEVDLLKNGKVGIPLGKKSMGVIYPEKTEAYYANGYSVQLAKECLQNIENVYLGRSRAGSDGKGLDDYLDALKIQHTSGTLNNAIKTQFGVVKAKLNLVQEPMSASIVNHAAEVDAAYVEMVKLLVLLKTDMPSALGIVITYQDGDGD
jgi:predicted lipoprotein